jgi:hypothetical protein
MLTEVLSWGRYGSKCANFRSGGCRFSIPIWVGKRYKAEERKKDGKLTYRLVGTVGYSVSGDTIPKAVMRQVIAESKATGIPIMPVRHGQLV